MTRLINLTFLGLGAWLIATTMSTISEMQLLRPVPTAVRALRTAATVSASLSLERLATLTGLTPQEDRAAEGSTDERPTRFDARLLGTLIDFERPHQSLAEVVTLRSGRGITVAVGENIDGAEVIGIERTRVWVRVDGKLAFIDASTAPTASAGPVRQRSESEFELARADLFTAISQYGSDASRPTLVPVPKGIRVEIKPGSLYASLGLESGDVIRRVNGEDMASVIRHGLEWVGQLQRMPKIDLELERGGTVIRRSYALQ